MDLLNRAVASITHQLDSQYNRISSKMTKKNVQSDNSDSQQSISLSTSLLSILAPFEEYFVSIQSILIWERPYISAVSLIAFNCLYWLIVSWTRRFFSIVSIVFLLASLYECWSHYIWPEVRARPPDHDGSEGWTPIHPKVLSAPELTQYINEIMTLSADMVSWFWQLRKNQPGLFCSLVTIILLISAIIGHLVPGVVIVYIILMTIALGPGIGLYVVPESWFQSLRGFLGRSSSSTLSSSSQAAASSSSSSPKYNTSGAFNEQSRKSSEGSVKCDHLEESFELDKDESSLQLLSKSQLDQTLDFELGFRPNRDSSSPSSSNHSSLQLVPSNQFGNGTETGDELEDYEIISDSELPDDTSTPNQGKGVNKNMLESDL